MEGYDTNYGTYATSWRRTAKAPSSIGEVGATGSNLPGRVSDGY